jgi:S-adenosylmethionine hydrolase
MPTYDWITLTTDYGLSDGFAGMLHGVIAQQAPWVGVVDITHQIPPGDVPRGAAILAQVVGHFPPAVHLGVVDPGVGTSRRALAIETPGGILVGPDNGLLPGAADALGGVVSAVRLTNRSWFSPSVSNTFHGRDVFAPVAARLAAGLPLAAAGPALDPAALVRLPEPVVVVGDGFLEAEVLTVDRFGNVQLAAPGSALDGLTEVVLVGGVRAIRGTTFADGQPGRLIVYVDSAGKVAIAINGGRAVVALAVTPGDTLRIVSAGGDA